MTVDSYEHSLATTKRQNQKKESLPSQLAYAAILTENEKKISSARKFSKFPYFRAYLKFLKSSLLWVLFYEE